MVDNFEKQFDSSLRTDEPKNKFWIVHVHNKSEIYHLTRQVLLDSRLEQDTYCFFYHILSKDINEFNEMYGSFACLIPKYHNYDYEGTNLSCLLPKYHIYEAADLYLNVNSNALECIIKYVQTGKIDYSEVCASGWKNVEEIIDLATMFAMPNLVSLLRNFQSSEEAKDMYLKKVKEYIDFFDKMYNVYNKNSRDYDKFISGLNNFVDENKGFLVDFYKDNYHRFDLTVIMLLLLAKNHFTNDM